MQDSKLNILIKFLVSICVAGLVFYILIPLAWTFYKENVQNRKQIEQQRITINRIFRDAKWDISTLFAPEYIRRFAAENVHFYLDFKKLIEIKNAISIEAIDEGIEMQILNRVKANLSGISFEISTSDHYEQIITPGKRAEWTWQIKSKSIGSKELCLELILPVYIGGELQEKTIYKEIRTVKVAYRESDLFPIHTYFALSIITIISAIILLRIKCVKVKVSLAILFIILMLVFSHRIRDFINRTTSPKTTKNIDKILEDLEWDYIDFSVPDTLEISEIGRVHLVLDIDKTLINLKQKLASSRRENGMALQATKRFYANLSGLNFIISPITEENQIDLYNREIEWSWELEPKNKGRRSIFLTLHTYLYYQGQLVPQQIGYFERELEILAQSSVSKNLNLVLDRIKADNFKLSVPSIIDINTTTKIEAKFTLEHDLNSNLSRYNHLQMRGLLSGQNFSISRITPELQSIAFKTPSKWSWEVKPKNHGKKQIHLAMNAIININDRKFSRVIYDIDKEIDVRFPLYLRISIMLKNYWQWVLATIIIPIFCWYWKKKDSSLNNA